MKRKGEATVPDWIASAGKRTAHSNKDRGQGGGAGDVSGVGADGTRVSAARGRRHHTRKITEKDVSERARYNRKERRGLRGGGGRGAWHLE